MARTRRNWFERWRTKCETPQLEERIEAAFSSAAFSTVATPTVQRAPLGQSTEAQPDSLVLAEGTCTVRLPAPKPELVGRMVIVARESASGTVTVVPTLGSVSGGSSASITTGQQRTFWCSGDDWH